MSTKFVIQGFIEGTNKFAIDETTEYSHFVGAIRAIMKRDVTQVFYWRTNVQTCCVFGYLFKIIIHAYLRVFQEIFWKVKIVLRIAHKRLHVSFLCYLGISNVNIV